MTARQPAIHASVRPLALSDEAALYKAVRESIASLSWWFPWCRPDYSPDDAAARVRFCVDAWQSGTEYGFGVFQGGDLLGCVGLNAVDHEARSANLGYWIGEPYRGQGIATRASRDVAMQAFDALGLDWLEIVALPHNAPSIAVARRLGAVPEPSLRREVAFQGRTEAGIVHLLTRQGVPCTPEVAIAAPSSTKSKARSKS